MKAAKEQEKKPSVSGQKRGRPGRFDTDYGLFEELRKLRMKIAKEERVPPYIVFSDKSLKDMSAIKPATKKEFLEVGGVGDHKCQKYGERFLAAIAKYKS